MSNFLIFLIVTALHAPAAIVLHDAEQIEAPKIIVANLNHSAPCIVFAETPPEGFFYELDYITPVGKISFRTVETAKQFDIAWGSPLYVRARVANRVVKGKWSQMVYVAPLERHLPLANR